MDATASQLLQALGRLGQTKTAQAKAIGLTPRQYSEWQAGRIPRIIRTLADAGVIAFVQPDTATANTQN